MKLEMTMRPMTGAESMYSYTQSQDIMGRSGCIGHLRADMGFTGNEFYTCWEDHNSRQNTQHFKNDFDRVINALRGKNQPLNSRQSLSKLCYSTPDSMLRGNRNDFGFRVDTTDYSYMMRMTPNCGEYNLYCYCYEKAVLDSHMQKAETGIRFITSSYKELFRIPDGGKITITARDGKQRELTCRYIDDYHFAAEGRFGTDIYHICQFAEQSEASGCKISPGRIRSQEVYKER